MEILRALLSGVSAGRPSHSLFMDGEMLPLEARMGGIFLGFLAVMLVQAARGRLDTPRLPVRAVRAACWALLAAMALDGLNAFVFDGGLPHVYPPTTGVRLVTGLLAGGSLAHLALPVSARMLLGPSRATRTGATLLDGLLSLGALLLLGLLLLWGAPWLLWPVALAMVAAVVAAFAVANVAILARGRQTHLTGTLVAAIGLAFVELAALGALRAWLATGLGLTWGA